MAERKIKNLTSDYLTCTICWNVYANPKILECGHSFCAKCLEDYIQVVMRKQDCFECPICRHHYDLSETTEPVSMVQSLANDSVSLSILKALGLQNNSEDKTASSSVQRNLSNVDVGAVSKPDHTYCACARHREKPLDIYCSKHDVVICSVCANNDHTLPECDCTSVRKVINKRFSAIKGLVAQQSADASQLFDSQIPEVKTVRVVHDELQKCVNDVEESFKDIYRVFQLRLESVRRKATATVEKDESVSEVRRLQEHLVSRVKSFDSDTSDNPNDMLQAISLMCIDSSELQRNITLLSEKLKTGSLMKYAESDLDVLDAFVSNVKGLVPSEFQSFDQVSNSERNDRDYVMVTKSGAFEDFQSNTAENGFEVSQQISFSAKSPGEEKCQLSGVALVGTAAMVIVDQANKKLKKFKLPEGKYLHELIVESEPHQVATLRGTNEVAVSLWDLPKIMIVATDPVLVVVNTIDTSTEYIGLTSHVNDGLAASSIVSRRVDVLNTNNAEFIRPKQQQTVYQSSRRRSFPDRLAATQDGKIVIRNRHRNEMCCFGSNRMLLWSRRLKFSVADVTCFRGKIVASLRDKNALVHFREDGQGDMEYIETRSLIRHPWAIDAFKDCLVVTEDAPSDNVHILVFA